MKKFIIKIWKTIRSKKKKNIFAVIVLIIFMILILSVELKNGRSIIISEKNATAGEIETICKENGISNETIGDIKEQESDSIIEKNTSDIQKNNEVTTENKKNLESNNQKNNVTSDYFGKLKVTGGYLTDEAGNIVQLKGISTHGIAWFPDYINEKCFAELHNNFGINVIRIAMYTSEYNGYCTGGDKEYLKDLIDKGVMYAIENNMYVIIDWHILSDGNPNIYSDEAKKFFAEMSSKYSSTDNVIYEICNEPNSGTSWQEIKKYADEIIPVIREYDKDAVILVGTPNWSQDVDKVMTEPLTGYENIMYTFHFYAATHKYDMRDKLQKASASGLPIFVSEFGICDASGTGKIDTDESEEWIKLLNDNNISYVIWNLSNKNETSSLINFSCAKVSGFNTDDLSECGKWFLKIMTGKSELGDTSVQKQENGQQDRQQNNYSSEKQENNTSISNQTENIEENIESTAELINSWQSGDRVFYQYNIKVTNKSGKNCSKWTTKITFNEGCILEDKWNGKCALNKNILTIVSEDYNGKLEKEETIGNIGIIVSGSSNLKVKS